METLIRCHCGFEARANNEDGLIAEVQRHASEAHGMALSHDEALLLAFRAELDCDHASTQTRQRSRPRPSDNVTSDFKEDE